MQQGCLRISIMTRSPVEPIIQGNELSFTQVTPQEQCVQVEAQFLTGALSYRRKLAEVVLQHRRVYGKAVLSVAQPSTWKWSIRGAQHWQSDDAHRHPHAGVDVRKYSYLTSQDISMLQFCFKCRPTIILCLMQPSAFDDHAQQLGIP